MVWKCSVSCDKQVQDQINISNIWGIGIRDSRWKLKRKEQNDQTDYSRINDHSSVELNGGLNLDKFFGNCFYELFWMEIQNQFCLNCEKFQMDGKLKRWNLNQKNGPASYWHV